MATVHYTASNGDRKGFTPVSAALGDLSNGAGTIVALIKRATAGATDLAGLVDSTGANFYHSLSLGPAGSGTIDDDDGIEYCSGLTDPTTGDTTNWWFCAIDWSSSGGTTERTHTRNQTGAGAGSPGSWSHGNTGSNSAGSHRSGPGTSGHFFCGFVGDADAGAFYQGIVAVWNVRLADADYGDWRKTSDLWNHSAGHPIFLAELTSNTPTDLSGGNTFSSGISAGSTVDGTDPDNWTFDGIGSAVAAGSSFAPPRMPLGV